MTPAKLKSTGALLAIAMAALLPTLRSTRDPGRDAMRDIRAFQARYDREALRRERPLRLVAMAAGGAGAACMVLGFAGDRRESGVPGNGRNDAR